MKFKFKVQPYQTNAVDSVVDCFAGQVSSSQHNTYTIDPGKAPIPLEFTGFKNADILLTESQLKENVHEVQLRQNLPLSEVLISSAKCPVNLDIEMETGTGKTYCYIKTNQSMMMKPAECGWRTEALHPITGANTPDKSAADA